MPAGEPGTEIRSKLQCDQGYNLHVGAGGGGDEGSSGECAGRGKSGQDLENLSFLFRARPSRLERRPSALRPGPLAPRAIATEGGVPVFLRLHPGPVREPSQARRYRRTRRVAAAREGCSATADDKGNAVTHSLHLQSTPHRGACGKPRIVPHNRQPQTRTYGDGRSEMHVLLSTYGSGARGRRTVGGTRGGAVAGTRRMEGCDALVATGVAPAGAWR